MRRIGLKLDRDFKVSPSYKELYGGHDILKFLYKIGVRTLETPVGPETNQDELFEHIRECIAAGFIISLHPYTERQAENPAHFSLEENNPCKIFHQAIFQVCNKSAQLQQTEAVVNIHPAAEHIQFSRKGMMEKSIAFYKWANYWCQDNAPMVKPVAELQIGPNKEEDIRRIGDCYDELLEIATKTNVGICWDFGHAFMNTLRFDVPLYPPDELIKHISHVHCHDVSFEDHQPLIHNKVPWQNFLEILSKNNFKGTIILEVIPQNFLSAGGLVSLTGSIKSIKKVI